MELLDGLRRDHANVARMMHLAMRELDEFESGGSVDYDLLEDIMRYITGFSDVHHHPAEDLLYEELGKVSAEAARDVESIVEEHAEILRLGREFLEALESVEEQAIVRRDVLLGKGRRYFEALGRHMGTEENHLFPLAERKLGPDAWQTLEARAARPPDPLFGPKVEREYSNLWDRIQAHTA